VTARPLPYTGRVALTTADDGRVLDPTTPEEWDTWVSAGRTRNYLEDDSILDWLHRHGAAKGFLPDDELEGFDPRTDFRAFGSAQGIRFEDRVVELLGRSVSVVRIGDGWEDAQNLAKAEETLDAMRAGVPLIHQAVLRNPQNRTYGSVDLLVRSDVLETIVPGTLAPAEWRVNAPALGPQAWHYRVVDIKFKGLVLLKDGAADGALIKYMAQVWVYNQALGRIQGYTPPASYLLGRGWTQGAKNRGSDCFDRLARVDHDRLLGPADARFSLADKATAAVAWVRRMRTEGAAWEVLPSPSVPELYPLARTKMDQPWHQAKARIAAELAELTMLPAMTPERRRVAHTKGLLRWDDPRVTAERLGLSGANATMCDAVLAANRAGGTAVVLPSRIVRAAPAWRTPAPLELYVDFETVSSLADDFTTLPQAGGQALIFQVGCGWYEGDRWRFWQRTTERIDLASEAAMLAAWVEHVDGLLAARGLGFGQLRVVHWSPAEATTLDTAYNSARRRHPSNAWPDIPWFDALGLVVRAEPITVRGAFAFGLKPIAKAMRAAGLIDTTWDDGPTDGLGAMTGAWWCDAEARRLGVPMGELPLMQEIGRYNEVDCRAMAEVIGWLRRGR
jgi:hypothetical protein